MGQKVNPISNRLGIIRGWDSNWFGGKNFGDNLVEDMKIRKYLNERLAKASVSRIVIERTLKLVTITICTARPGLVIGKGGQDVDKLKATPQPASLPWLPIGVSVAGVALVAVLAFLLWPKGETEQNPVVETKTVVGAKPDDYAYAVEKLKTQGAASDGLKILESLSDAGSYEATYLLSRLKFDAKNKRDFDNIPDSIWTLQLTSKVKTDNRQAHELLKKAVAINPNDCHSQYALGVDYLIGDRETFEGRQIAESKKCLDRALQLAKDAGEQDIVQNIEQLYREYASEFRKAERR